MPGPHVCTYTQTPVGRLLLVANDRGLTQINFEQSKRPTQPAPGWVREDAPFREIVDQLAAYFAGELREFDVSLAPEGTPFQQSVWRALRDIAYGTTVSYAELAVRIGRPTATRAVGAANGANPLPIVIPCHRVIGADGRLTGFGGGLPVKRALLGLEGVLPAEPNLWETAENASDPVHRAGTPPGGALPRGPAC